MIDFYTAPTPNGHRVALALEECGVSYRVHKMNLRAGDQLTPEFRAINPAGMVPVIIDPDGPDGQSFTLAQSGAITIYLAEKTNQFVPQDPRIRNIAWQWFMQASSDCVLCSQAIAQLVNHAPSKSPSSVEFFEERMIKMFGVVDRRLQDVEFLAGDEYSIADIALYPITYVRKHYVEKASLTGLLRWMRMLEERPTVRRAMTVSV